jgi:hypothetical protein
MRLPLATLAAVVASLLAPPATPVAAPAQAQAAFEVAIQDDPVFVLQRWYNQTTAITQARQMGARSARINIIWAQFVAEHKSFAKWDLAVDRLNAQGIRPQITIMGTPVYINGDRSLGHRYPSPSRLYAFARLIAQHFKGRVHRYAIWNEPNLERYLSPKSQAPKLYYRLYKAGYLGVKRVDRTAQVLWGELTSPKNTDPLGFLQKVVRYGPLLADGFALHAFQFYGLRPTFRSSKYPGGIGNTPAIKKLLAQLRKSKRFRTPRGGTVPIYFTEFSYQSSGYMKMSESKRASYALSAFRYAKAQGVKQLVWYQLVHAPAAAQSTSQPWDSGVIGLNGCVTPTYRAIARFSGITAFPNCTSGPVTPPL